MLKHLTSVEQSELSRCADLKTGPQYFISNYIHIVHPVHTQQKLQPFNYQIELVNEYCKNKNIIVNIARQMGASTISAAYLLWNALFVPNTTVCVASQSRTTSNAILYRIKFAFEQLPEFLKVQAVSKINVISFSNGSTIKLSQLTGISCDILYVENCAYLSDSVAADLKNLLQFCGNNVGKCILSSTPTENSLFVEIWNKSVTEYIASNSNSDSFVPVNMPWILHAHRDDNWAKYEISRMGLDFFTQEYECIVPGQTQLTTHKRSMNVD